VSLLFEKLESQIALMGKSIANQGQTIAEQSEIAFGLLQQASNNDMIWGQIMQARHQDAGFRGAAPMPGKDSEPFNTVVPLPAYPERATIYAADGSQIYPDPHGPAAYWLTNIGIFIYHHGHDFLPEMISEPQLFYEEPDVRDVEGRLIANAAINARRTVYEMQALSAAATRQAEDAEPRLALYDGPLIGMPMGKDVANAQELTMDYHEAIDFMYDAGTVLCGYVDRPSSRFVIYTLYLMTLESDSITRGNVQNAPIEGLMDVDLYKRYLPSGARSALLIQQSPLNKDYKEQHGDHQEIAFFYMNTAASNQEPYIARVEVPMWVAKRPAMVAQAQALIYHQCQIIDRYPYSLTRADEIAVVQPAERRALDERIAIAMLSNQQNPARSQKLNTKGFARSGRQQHQGV
jgi:NurA domain